MKRFMILFVLLLAGCGLDQETTPAPVQLTAHVTFKGRPITNATLHLQPTHNGAQAALPVRKGEVQGTVVPGKYAYYFESANRAKNPGFPEQYRTASIERLVEIGPQATTITLSLDE